MKIAILGMGCAKCNELENNVRLAVQQTGIDAEIEHVKDIKKIMTYGVLSTPALAIDGQVKIIGKIPGVEELKKIFGGK